MSTVQAKSGRIKDWLFYVGIAVLIVILLWLFAMHQATTGGSPDLPLKWLGFAGMTGIVFGYVIRACRRFWERQKFWLFLALFFAGHSGAGVFVLLRVPVVPLMVYAVLIPIEYLALAAYLGYFLDS